MDITREDAEIEAARVPFRTLQAYTAAHFRDSAITSQLAFDGKPASRMYPDYAMEMRAYPEHFM